MISLTGLNDGPSDDKLVICTHLEYTKTIVVIALLPSQTVVLIHPSLDYYIAMLFPTLATMHA
jgi:hypothetical protein